MVAIVSKKGHEKAAGILRMKCGILRVKCGILSSKVRNDFFDPAHRLKLPSS